MAEKTALVAPAGTATDTGTVTDALLLLRSMLSPPVGAAPLSETVQTSVPAPVIAELLHVNPVTVNGTAMPVPVSATTVELPFVASLVTVSCPDAVPVDFGTNWTCKPKWPPAGTVTGKVGCPTIEKDSPLIATFEIWTAPVP
jgi:hypothetical protein